MHVQTDEASTQSVSQEFKKSSLTDSVGSLDTSSDHSHDEASPPKRHSAPQQRPNLTARLRLSMQKMGSQRDMGSSNTNAKSRSKRDLMGKSHSSRELTKSQSSRELQKRRPKAAMSRDPSFRRTTRGASNERPGLGPRAYSSDKLGRPGMMDLYKSDSQRLLLNAATSYENMMGQFDDDSSRHDDDEAPSPQQLLQNRMNSSSSLLGGLQEYDKILEDFDDSARLGERTTKIEDLLSDNEKDEDEEDE